jgi:DNA-binding MarR family transcriptional regulator
MHGHGPGHCRKHDRGFGRERVLNVIGSYENGVRQKVLTEELRINPSSVSEMISKLENDGYVKRTVDPTDKRATLISLTELGEARAAELQDEKNEKLNKAFGNLTDDEKEQLIALLEKLTAEK